MHSYLANTHPFFLIELNMLKWVGVRIWGLGLLVSSNLGHLKEFKAEFKLIWKGCCNKFCYCGMVEVRYKDGPYLHF